MQLDLCERLRRGDWTIADWRRSYSPGGDVFYIPALKAANQGVWRDGALVSVAGFVISTQFTERPTPSQLGTLWPDRLVETLADRLARDEVGRPLIRYCEAYAILQLVPEDPTSGWPCFNVANLDRHPKYLQAWVEHSRTEQLFRLRPNPFVPRDEDRSCHPHRPRTLGEPTRRKVAGWQ